MPETAVLQTATWGWLQTEYVINMFPNSQIPASCYEQVQFMYEHWLLTGQGP